MMRLLFLLLLPLLGLAQAQVVTPFDVRYKTNDTGAITLIGNTLMCVRGIYRYTDRYGCNPRTMNDPNANNSQTMVFLNADSASPSWPSGRGGSSSATLNLPSGSQVLFAGLYWGARAGESEAGRDEIFIKPPGYSEYQSITGRLLGTITNWGQSDSRPYVAFADVTSLVRTSGNGTYWVGGILAATGNDDLGFYAGWSLVVVYRNPAEPLRNLVVYDGLAAVSSGNNVTITPTGFLAPLTGPVNARVGAVAFEGDGGIPGDNLRLNGSNLSDAQNPADNFFNSSISLLGSRFTAKTPDYVNQMAVDADIVDASGRIPNGATSVTLQFTSSQDAYFPAVLTFQIDLYVPDLTTTFSKSYTDPNGGQVVVGDTLEYTISFTNTGLDGATNVVLRDPIPAGTEYVSGSLEVTQNATGAPTGTFTDGSGDDIAEYDPSCPEFNGNPCVRFRLGTLADANQGGLILPGEGAEVKFKVRVLPSAAGRTVTNTAQVSYNSQTLGTGFSEEASVSASVDVPNPPTVAKAFSPDSIPVGDTSTLTITLTNPNPVEATLTADLVDTLPRGVVVASNPSASTDCPDGSVRATPGEGAVTLKGGAKIPAGGSCTVTVNVTSSTAGTHTNDIPAGALETDLGRNQDPASATLTVFGVSLSGQVYHDREPDGVKNGEGWDGPTVYVKLIQDGRVVAVRAVSADGSFTFNGVAPGDYTLIVDDNDSTADTEPTPPSKWLFVNPPSGSRSVSVGNANVEGQDFGLFRGGVVEGRVFYDDGEGGGAANDARQNGAERGVGGVVVGATDGTNTRTATTGGNGFYRLYIPASWGNVTLSHPLRPATGWNDGSNPRLVTSWADAQGPDSSGAVISLGSAGSLAGSILVRNFGVVRLSELKPDQAGQITSPGSVTYAHLFRPGTLGNVELSLANTPSFTYQARVDKNCNGTWDSGEDFSPLPLSFTVGSTWPRDPDGRLTACALEVRVLAPAGLPAGYTDIALFKSSLKWQNNPSVTEERFVTDTTTVIQAGLLKLSKEVRNLTWGTSFATSVQAKPGEVLEYRIAYQNIGSQPVFEVVLQDPIPFFSTLVQDAYGPAGEVELKCPNGANAYPDLGSTSIISLDLADYCQLDTAPHPNGGSAPALLPGQGGYFVYRVRVH